MIRVADQTNATILAADNSSGLTYAHLRIKKIPDAEGYHYISVQDVLGIAEALKARGFLPPEMLGIGVKLIECEGPEWQPTAGNRRG